MRVEIERVDAPPAIELEEVSLKECAALGLNPEQAVAMHFELTGENFVAKAGDEVLAVFGYRPMSVLNLQAIVWMLATPAGKRYSVGAARATLEWTRELLSRYPVLVCWVHKDETHTRKWLRWLGFHHASNCLDFMEMRATRGER